MKLRAFLATAVAALTAQTAQAEQGVVRTPTSAEIVFAYPRAAYRAHLGGAVSLDCAIDPSGTPGGCEVVSESPTENGFGEAATKLVAYMKFGEASAQYRARFTIEFEPPQAEKWPDYLHIPSGHEIQRLWPQETRGEYLVACAIGKDAEPRDCEIVEPVHARDELQKAAVESMRLFKFSPALLHGKPVPAFAIVPFRFH